jgi:hypothetical protein
MLKNNVEKTQIKVEQFLLSLILPYNPSTIYCFHYYLHNRVHNETIIDLWYPPQCKTCYRLEIEGDYNGYKNNQIYKNY